MKVRRCSGVVGKKVIDAILPLVLSKLILISTTVQQSTNKYFFLFICVNILIIYLAQQKIVLVNGKIIIFLCSVVLVITLGWRKKGNDEVECFRTEEWRIVDV